MQPPKRRGQNWERHREKKVKDREREERREKEGEGRRKKRRKQTWLSLRKQEPLLSETAIPPIELKDCLV